MSQIHVRQPHSAGRAGARERLQSFESMLAKYKVKLAWKGDKAAIKGLGVSGDVAIDEDAVDVHVSLGMLARAAGIDADRLKGSIARRLQEAFAD